MRSRVFFVPVITLTFACGTIVGIRDTEEVSDVVTSDGGSDSTTATAPDGAAPQDGGSADATTDAPTRPPITGGAAHFLQPGDAVTLEYETGGAKKTLVVSANGDFELPEPAFAVRVAGSPTTKRCWLRASSAARVDVRCVLADKTRVNTSQTSSTAFTALVGSETTVHTDLASSTLFIAFSMPFATTSGPEANWPDYSTLYVRAIVDDDPTRSIELRRGSTFWHQPWNQTLFGTINVPAGAHKVAVEYRHEVAHPVTGRTAIIGGTLNSGDFTKSELITVALESLETYDRMAQTPMTADFTLSGANAWQTMSSLSDTTTGPRKAVVMAYYPDVYFTSSSSSLAGFFSLMSGLSGNTSLVTESMRHLQDENGYRSIAMVASTSVNGPFAFRVDQRTEAGPNVATATRGAALTTLLFQDSAKVQTATFSGDGDYAGGTDHFSNILGTTFQAQTSAQRALVFLDVNLMMVQLNGGAAEIQLMDSQVTEPLVNGVIQSWSFQYGQGCSLATIADFSSPGPHTLSLRVRPLHNTSAYVRHGSVPDGRGKSAVTIVPLE